MTSRAEAWPGASRASWEDDTTARKVVRAFPDGLSQQCVADVMGVSRQRVHQLEQRALLKLIVFAEENARATAETAPMVTADDVAEDIDDGDLTDDLQALASLFRQPYSWRKHRRGAR